MPTPAFEAFQAEQKKAKQTLPGSAPATQVKSGKTSSYESFLAERNKSKVPPAPAPSQAPPSKPPEPTFSSSGGYLDSIRKPEPLDIGSTSSTTAMPTLAQSTPINSAIDKIAAGGQAIAAKAKELRKSNDTGKRVVGALGDSAIETGKGLVDKLDAVSRSPSVPTAIDFGLNFMTLGMLDFIPGAAPEIVGALAETGAKLTKTVPVLNRFVDPKKVGQSVQKGVQYGMEKIFNDFLYEGVGGKAADVYEKQFGPLSEVDRNAIKDIMTIGTMTAGILAAAKGMNVKAKAAERTQAARSSVDLLQPMGESIGLKIKTDSNGRPVMPSQEKINTAHKEALGKAASEGGTFMTARMDAADTARKMLSEYRNLGAEGFEARWKPVFEKGTQIAETIQAKAEVNKEQVRVGTEAQQVNRILTEPATPQTRRLADNLSSEAQFAFEQEMVDMAGQNDPKLQKAAETGGYAYERTSIPFDDRPAYFDALTNKITLNEYAVRQTLDRVWAGDVLKVGEGKTTTVFRKLDGESFEKLKNRYEQTLIDHELAHAKTITPEDVARLRGASGNEAELNKIRKELEDRANEFSFQKANDLDEKTNTAVDSAIERVSQGLRIRENLDSMKFPASEMEAAYSRWKKIVRRSPDYARADWDQLEAGLKKSPAYKNKSVKALFEDGLEKTGQAGSSKSSVDSFDRLLEEFQKRYTSERKILDEYKMAREAQQKLVPEVQRNPAVDRAVKAEMRAEKKVRKLEGQARRTDLRLLRERITRRLEKEVLREKADVAQEKLRTKFNNKTEAQQALVDFMREARVPSEVRAKFLTDLKNARKPDDVAGIIGEIKREYNVYERKEKISSIVDQLRLTRIKRDASGKNVGKFTAEVQRKLDFVRKIAKESRNDLNQQIIKLVDEARIKMADEGNLQIGLPDEVASRIELLELGGLKDQTLTQLKRTEATLQQLIETGKTDRKNSVDLRRDKIKRFISSSSEDLIGQATRPKATQRDLAAHDNDPWYKRFYNSSAIFQDLTRNMGGVLDTAGNKTAKAVNNAVDDFSREAAQMRERLEIDYGKNWRVDMADLANGQKKFGDMPNANGVMIPVRATRGMAMDLYMRMQEAGTREFITSKDGLAYTPEIIDSVLSVLKPEDIKTADWIQRQGYTQQFKRLAPVYESRTGIPLGNVENFAGTRRFEKGQTMGGEAAIGFIEDMMDSSISYRLSTNPNFVKSRVASLGQLKFSDNPISDYLIYSKRAAHYIEVGEFAQEWKALLADYGIRESITEKYGKSYLEALQYQVDNIVRGGFDMKGRDSGASKLMDQVAGNISSALLFNPRVWSGQLSSVFGMKAEMALLPGSQADFWRGVKNAKANKADVLKYSAAVRTRLEATPSELLSQFTGDKGKIGRAIDRIKTWQAIPLEKMDSFTTVRGASGIFEAQKAHYLKEGFDLEKASQLAGKDVDNIITRTQSTRQYIGKSQLETGALRYFVQLKQQPTKIFRGNIEAGKLLRQGRINGKQFAAFFIWNNVIQGAAYTALRAVPAYLMAQAALSGYRAIGEDEAAKKKAEEIKERYSVKGLASDVAYNGLSSVTNAPIAGDILNTIIQNTAFGKNYEYRPSLINALTDDLLAATKQMSGGDWDEGIMLGLRAVSRSAGIGDPVDAAKWVMSIMSASNTNEKTAARNSPEGKEAARVKRVLKKASGG